MSHTKRDPWYITVPAKAGALALIIALLPVYGLVVVMEKHGELRLRSIVRRTVKKDAKFRNWLKGPGDPDATELGRALHASLRQYA